MYTILLTDDEQIMIDSLTMTLTKNFASEVKLFSALSGSEALEIVAKNQIDIIFMDINMPGLNGLQTVSYIKQSKPDTVVIILSAFDEFEYAKEAVNIGAFKYLTKPVNRNTVIDTVKSAFDEIDKRRGRVFSEVELHKKLEIVSPMVESDFIYSAAFGGKDIREYFSYFEIEHCVYCFCCIEIAHLDDKNKYEVYNEIREILCAKTRCIIGSFMANRLAVFFYFPDSASRENDEKELKERIKEIFSLLSMRISKYIRFGVSPFETAIEKTTVSYNKALEALISIKDDEEGLKIAFCEKVSLEESESEEKMAEKIYGRVMVGDSSALPPLVSAYIKKLYSLYDGKEDKIKNALFSLLVNVKNVATKIAVSYKNALFENAFSFFCNEHSKDALEEFVLTLCSDSANAVKETLSKSENPIITMALKYINSHLSTSFSLEEVSRFSGVSPFYLSKLFKEEKKENFTAFVTNLRLEKAKTLLQSTRSSIKEVSAEVGYNDQNYFSRIFRYQYGMTPTEFRDAKK